MLSGDWRWITRAGIGLGILVGLAYVAWAVWFFSNYQRLHENQRLEIASQQQHASDENVDWRCNVLAAPFGAECQPKDERSEKANQYAEADLEAQQDMAEWALIVALVSVPGLFVSGLGLWALYWTFAQTREIGKAQERGVLIIEGGSLLFYTKWTQPILEIEIGVKNVGRTFIGKIDFDLTVTYTPATNDMGNPLGSSIIERGYARLSFLASEKSEVMKFGGIPTKIPFDDMEKFGEIGADVKPRIGTDLMEWEMIKIVGVADYIDTFGDKRTASFVETIDRLDAYGRTYFFFGTGTDYEANVDRQLSQKK